MNAESLKTLFDTNWIIVMFVIGLVWKYVPALRRYTNAVIPYLNFGAYALTKMAGVGTAQAAGFDLGQFAGGLGSALLGGFTNAIWARQLYEGFGRSLLEGLFKRKR